MVYYPKHFTNNRNKFVTVPSYFYSMILATKTRYILKHCKQNIKDKCDRDNNLEANIFKYNLNSELLLLCRTNIS